MDIINGERAIMNTNHKIKFLLKNASDLDFNIDDAEISYLINGKTNDSYLLDFKKFKLVLRLNKPVQEPIEICSNEFFPG